MGVAACSVLGRTRRVLSSDCSAEICGCLRVSRDSGPPPPFSLREGGMGKGGESAQVAASAACRERPACQIWQQQQQQGSS